MSANIAGVTKAATDTGETALVVLKTADALTDQAGALRSDVSDFLRRVRAG